MTTENKESIYHKLDEQRVIRDFADAICGDDGKKADVFFNSCSRYFEWSGGRLFFKKAGGEKIAATDPTVKQFFAEEYAFLLPAPKAEEHEFEGVNVTIDPLTVESALGGNITSKGAIAKIFGARPDASATVQTAAAEKTELFLQAERVKRNGGERERDDSGKFKTKASNPWSLEGWNLTKQMQTHRADPALAERLAKAANSRVGAARPTKVA